MTILTVDCLFGAQISILRLSLARA